MTDSKVSQTLALQAALNQHIDGLVEAATRAALLLEGSNMQNNQIRNVLNVAEESESVAVVTNFIRYQIGRSGTGQDWQHNGFGLQVIKDMTEPSEAIDRTLGDVMNSVTKRIGRERVPDDLQRQARVDLMRYYLGYLYRAFVFGSLPKDKIDPPKGQPQKGGWDYLKPVVEEPAARREG